VNARPTTGLEQLLGRIDRRLTYLGLFLITLAPLVGRWKLPLYVTEPPQMLRAAIEALPADKVVFITSNWDAGTQTENRPQLVAVARHLIRRGIKFAILSINSAQSPQLAQTAIEEAIRAEGGDTRWQYGRDWVNLGFKIGEDAWLNSFSKDVSKMITEDWKAVPLSRIPMMQGVRNFGPEGQISMLIDITGSNTIEKWYQFLSTTNVKIGLTCTAVMAPEQYPFLDSGQLSGLLTGMKGAAEYEQLLNAPGQGMPMMAGQSFAHLYIFLLILLGNVSLVAGWWGRRRAR
jgi:hypothetical protein